MCYSGLHVEVSTPHRSHLKNLTNNILAFGQADFPLGVRGGGGWEKYLTKYFIQEGGGSSVPWSNPILFYI